MSWDIVAAHEAICKATYASWLRWSKKGGTPMPEWTTDMLQACEFLNEEQLALERSKQTKEPRTC